MCNNAQRSSPLHRTACIRPLPLHSELPWLVAGALVSFLCPERAKKLGDIGEVRMKKTFALENHWQPKRTALLDLALDTWDHITIQFKRKD